MKRMSAADRSNGISGVTALSNGIEEKTDYSYATVYAHDASGRRRGLLETAYLGGGLPL